MPSGLQYLFMEAAREINGKQSYFSATGEFPAYRNSDVPQSPIAHEFLADQSSWILRYLPFWVAGLLSKMIGIAMPLAALLLPLFRRFATLSLRPSDRRLKRAYGELRRLEREVSGQMDIQALLTGIKRIEIFERYIEDINAPAELMLEYYTLRCSIALAREKLRSRIDRYDDATFT
ncbi:conserved hypothetical protein [Ricinus communis]|uniref:Uncharacterized protein n=1 Tax=Ricinus communis TaxID=3988 RepID=B9TJG7_RICCO|nr:conserved hypothetical protein [Ricinus communis]